MSDPARLLRMLEPAVRPGGMPAPQRPATLPIEQRSFDSLLEEARLAPGAGAGVEKTSGDPGVWQSLSSGPGAAADGHDERARTPSVSPLASLDRIENASLRQLMAGPGGLSPRPESSDR